MKTRNLVIGGGVITATVIAILVARSRSKKSAPALPPAKKGATSGAPKAGGVPLSKREADYLQLVREGKFQHQWVPLVSEANGHTARLWVSADALKIAGTRINASATLQQQIADLLGARLPTPKILDLMFEQRGTTIVPIPRPITSTTEAMMDNSKKIDAAIDRAGGASGIVSTVGKNWVLTNKLSAAKAANYGWHFVPGSFAMQGSNPATGMAGVRVVQPNATAHNPAHTDYSQIVQLVRGDMTVDGRPMAFDEVATDPELAPLVSHEGKLLYTRQPGVKQATLA